MPIERRRSPFIGLVAITWLLVGCGVPAARSVPPTRSTLPASVPSRATPTLPVTPAAGLSAEEAATLGSLERADDYPLYTMRYRGAYSRRASALEEARQRVGAHPSSSRQPWACSLFAALGDADRVLYGRNFDWDYSPAVLLFTDPPVGYASVSVVDMAYLGFEGTNVSALTELPLDERRPLLNAPFLPFDGMNERGLAVGMAAVPPGQMRPDPAKETIGSLGVIRQILDRAATVDEAVSILRRYNVDMEGGPPIHYLIADASGRAVLVEAFQGEMVAIPNRTPWHLATNFLYASVSAPNSAAGQCWRYDRISQRLTDAGGRLSTPDALALLAAVSQRNTQWSVVYGMSTGEILVAMGRRYDQWRTFRLGLDGR